MEKVNGIGGFFFRAQDPALLANWYRDNLGVNPIPSNADDQPWTQAAGATAFAPFPQATEYFGDAGKHWMLNFRVANLDAMMAQLHAAGIAVELNPDESFGRFARLQDPEGNPIELWEPQEDDAAAS